jgi:hypothetical protein
MSEAVKNRFFCRSEGGKSSEFRAGAIGDAVKYDKQDLFGGHSYGMVGCGD